MPGTPIVLVHGSYHQPAHYDPLIRLLTQDTEVIAPDIGMLPLTDSIALVQDIVDQATSPPVVVGHSFGGAVAGALRGVQHIVFLSGWVLDTDETAAALLARADDSGDSEFARALRFSADGSTAHISPEAAGTLFYADCTPEQTERAVGLLRPDTVLNFTLSPTAAQWKRTPTTYIATRRDRTWPPALAEEFAARCANVVTMDTSHSPYLSAPDSTAALIRDHLRG